MSEGASIPIPRDLLLEACAAAVGKVLKESGLLADLADAVAVLNEVRLLKAGLLSKEQAADMLGVAVRTFKRQVDEKKMWPEMAIMGQQECRYPLPTMIALMKQRKYKKAVGEDDLPDAEGDRQKAA